LVVDDEPDVEALIERRFRREMRKGSYEFTFAGDGVEALEKIEESDDFDIVLCDINMPRMDGLTLLERVQDRLTLTRAVMVSAYNDLANIRTAMNRGAYDFITKPIDFDDLRATIDKSLADLAQLRDALDKQAVAESARANLARYFSPNIVDELANQDQPLGPARRQDVAVLFVDIVGFTQNSEGLPPEEVFELLRAYHRRMEAEVFRHGGTMEKFIGDALMATFGVPSSSGRDASNAVACARAMIDSDIEWNSKRVDAGLPPVEIGIGLNFGPAVLGNIGSERNMAFAVIGDTVNTASRLEVMTRSLDCQIVASAEVVNAMHAEADAEAEAEILLLGFDERKPMAVRGRSKPVVVWTFEAQLTPSTE
jgi:adenylate cyclase